MPPSPHAPVSFDVTLSVSFGTNATIGLTYAFLIESLVAAADTGEGTGENVRVELTQLGELTIAPQEPSVAVANSTILAEALQTVMCTTSEDCTVSPAPLRSRRLESVGMQKFTYARILVGSLSAPNISIAELSTQLGVNVTFTVFEQVTSLVAVVRQTIVGNVATATQVIGSLQSFAATAEAILGLEDGDLTLLVQPAWIAPPSPPPKPPSSPPPRWPYPSSPPSPSSPESSPPPVFAEGGNGTQANGTGGEPTLDVDVPAIGVTSALSTDDTGQPQSASVSPAALSAFLGAAGLAAVLILLILPVCLCRFYCPHLLPGPCARLMLKKSPSLDWPAEANKEPKAFTKQGVNEVFAVIIRQNLEGRFCLTLGQDDEADDPGWNIFITDVGEIDVADDRAKLRKGDILRKVNTVHVSGQSIDTVFDILQTSGSIVELTVERPAEAGAAAALAAVAAAAKENVGIGAASSPRAADMDVQIDLDMNMEDEDFSRPSATPNIDEDTFERPPKTPHVAARRSALDADDSTEKIHVPAMLATPLSHHPPASPTEREEWIENARKQIDAASAVPARAAIVTSDHTSCVDVDISVAQGENIWVFDGAVAPSGWLIAMRKDDNGAEVDRGLVQEDGLQMIDEGGARQLVANNAPGMAHFGLGGVQATPAMSEDLMSPMGQILKPNADEAQAVVDAARALRMPMPMDITTPGVTQFGLGGADADATPALSDGLMSPMGQMLKPNANEAKAVLDAAKALRGDFKVIVPGPAPAPARDEPSIKAVAPVAAPVEADAATDVPEPAPAEASATTPSSVDLPASAPAPAPASDVVSAPVADLELDAEPPSDQEVKLAMPSLVGGEPGAQTPGLRIPPSVQSNGSQSSPVAEVMVPTGARPGETFRAMIPDGRELTIACPPDAEPGDVLEIELPPELPPGDAAVVNVAEPESPHHAPGDCETIEVAVPAGKQAGDTFSVQASWGGVFAVQVPRGTVPGSTLFIEVPKNPTVPPIAGTPALMATSVNASFSLHV